MRTIYNGVTGRSILEFLHEISENIIIALNLGISFAEHVVCKPLLCANRRGDRQIVDCHFLKIFDDSEDLIDCCEIWVALAISSLTNCSSRGPAYHDHVPNHCARGPEPTFAVFELNWLGFTSENRTVCGEGTKTREELEMHTPGL